MARAHPLQSKHMIRITTNMLCTEYIMQQLRTQTCCEDSRDEQFLDYS